MFCLSVAHLYSHLSKPVLDAVMVSVTLNRIATRQGSSGRLPLTLATIVIAISGQILRIASPRFGKLVAEESQRRGHLRFVHSRIITNAEEIAFYDGFKVIKMPRIEMGDWVQSLRFCTMHLSIRI